MKNEGNFLPGKAGEEGVRLVEGMVEGMVEERFRGGSLALLQRLG